MEASAARGIAPPRRRLPRPLLLLASVLLVLTPLESLAETGPAVVVEVDRRADGVFQARLARRLVVLELGDVEVPPPEGIGADQHSLFVRVLGRGDDEVRVELWEHGLYHGARTVRTGDQQPELAARRIALAAAALGRQLRVKRMAEARARAQLAAEQAEQDRLAALEPGPPKLRLGSLARASMMGDGELLLAGPGLEAQVAGSRGARAGLFVGALQGVARPSNPSSPLQWLEVGLAPAQAVALGEDATLELGLEAAAAMVRLTRANVLDGIAGQQETWSARGGVRVRLALRLGPQAALAIGPELGLVLRSIPLIDESGTSVRLGGAWLGLSAGLLLGEQPRCAGACARRAPSRRTGERSSGPAADGRNPAATGASRQERGSDSSAASTAAR